jgi:hypothetical protein
MRRIKLSKSEEWRFALQIGTDHDYGKSCWLELAAFSRALWFRIPGILKPAQRHVTTKMGSYTDTIRRQYGFSINREALHLYYGMQPGYWSRDDPSNSDRSACWFIPWNQTDRVRYDFLNLDGSLFRRVHDNPNGSCRIDDIRSAEKDVPKVKFKFNDYDGEEITATCYLYEMEWRYGIGLFRWVRYFRKPIIHRCLDMQFSSDIGHNKSTWKGGTIGHSVELLHGESALEAFIRYGSEIERYREVGSQSRAFSNITEV